MTDRALCVTRPIKVQGYDIDVMGIVSNIVYIRWFEDMRMAFMDEFYPFEKALAENTSPILRETHAEYLKPTVINDRVEGIVWAEEFTKSRWKLAIEIVVGDKVHCRGLQSGYYFDLEKKKVRHLPESLLSLFENAKKQKGEMDE